MAESNGINQQDYPTNLQNVDEIVEDVSATVTGKHYQPYLS